MDSSNIFDYVLQEEITYQTRPVPIVDGYEWSMFDHIRKTTLYKNSKFASGENDGVRPFKQIIRPILNVAYRSEGFDVKDIEPFVDDEENYYKSFLVRRFHSPWARKNSIDTFIDDLVESYVDYGGAIIKNVNDVKPEVVQLQQIAFCDQTDILGAPLGLKHQFSQDKLLSMKWDKEKVYEAIDMANAEKTAGQTINSSQKAETPGKYITVYEIHGMMPTSWLLDKYQDDPDMVSMMEGHDYTNQVQYITYYTDSKGEKHGICLFKNREKKSIFKLLLRDKIFGRGLGFGGVEELFEAQKWTNFSVIQLYEMLEAASVMLLQTADPAYATKNKISDLEKNTILHHDNAPITQVQIRPINYDLFEKSIEDWEDTARTIGSANDAQLGIDPATGTPFKLQDLVTQEGQGIHIYRRGKIATFVGEIYRDWILQFLVNAMNKGHKWLDELTLEEMQSIAETVANNETDRWAREQIITKNMMVPQAMADEYKQRIMDSFMKGGSKKFLEIVENEIKSIPVDVDINVAGKQLGLDKLTDKLTNVFRQIIQNPQILAIPAMAKLFNQIIESAGLDPIDFSGIEKAAPPAAPVPPGQNGGAPVPAQNGAPAAALA